MVLQFARRRRRRLSFARQCLQFLNDFRLRTWHMERKAFAFAFAFEIEPFAALAVFIPCSCPCSRCWLSNHRSPGRPYRNVNQTGHSTGSEEGGGFAQWISIGFSSVFGLSMHVAICTTDASHCLRFFCASLKLPSIRKLNFLGAFLINAAKCRRAQTLASLGLIVFLANHLAELELN